jgi:hypothetical protein
VAVDVADRKAVAAVVKHVINNGVKKVVPVNNGVKKVVPVVEVSNRRVAVVEVSTKRVDR